MSGNGQKMSGNSGSTCRVNVQEMSGNVHKCQKMSGNCPIGQEMVQDGHEMSGNGQKISGNGQEMVQNCQKMVQDYQKMSSNV